MALNIPVFTEKKLNELMQVARPLYDVVRLVDPGECRVMHNAAPEQDEEKADGCGRCYEVWGREERCWNCSSYRAALSGRMQEKTESLDGVAYRVVSVPVLCKDENGVPRSLCMEFVSILEQGAAAAPSEVKAIDTDYVYAEQSSRRDEALSIIMEAAGHRIDTGLVCYDAAGECIYANEAAFRLFHIRNDLDELKRFLDAWMELNYQERAGRKWVQYLQEGSVRRPLATQYFEIHGSEGQLLGSYFSFSDESPLSAAEELRQFRERHDPMTGIYNWEGFEEAAVKHLSDHRGVEHLLVRVNVKEFKLVNQLFGVEKGNEVLRSLAAMVRDLACEGEIYGRIISDHFCILVESENYDEERYRRRAMAVAENFGTNVYKLHLQFGIYRIGGRSEDISIMCDRAKMALKSIQGDLPVSFAEYDNSLILNALYESEIINSFEEALATDQLHIFLQSQNDRQGNVLAAEALARWIHPEQGIIPPDRFIGVLERAGRIHELDQYIWEKTVRQLSEWTGTAKEGIRLSVNISPKDLQNVDIEKVFCELVDKYKVSPGRLNLEITETAVMSNPQQVIELVGRLQKRGFAVEIDDFGSGYSSLNLLKDVHANILKIDRAFLARTEQEKRSEIILTHIINMARDLQMGVITEGVETERQLDMLYTLGCNMFQGYYFSKPIPVSDFERKYF